MLDEPDTIFPRFTLLLDTSANSMEQLRKQTMLLQCVAVFVLHALHQSRREQIPCYGVLQRCDHVRRLDAQLCNLVLGVGAGQRSSTRIFAHSPVMFQELPLNAHLLSLDQRHDGSVVLRLQVSFTFCARAMLSLLFCARSTRLRLAITRDGALLCRST